MPSLMDLRAIMMGKMHHDNLPLERAMVETLAENVRAEERDSAADRLRALLEGEAGERPTDPDAPKVVGNIEPPQLELNLFEQVA